MIIAIAGAMGMVGKALSKVLDCPIIYDPPKKIGSVEELNTAEVVFICVPTPGEGDISIVEDVVSKIKTGKIYHHPVEDLNDIEDYAKTIVIKSTVPPGTTDYLQEKYPQHKFLFNPEFLTEARADEDMIRPDTQLIGYTDKSYSVATDILNLLPKAPFERIVPAKEAEMAKYFRNTWFTTKVIFANQIYDLCQKIGVDYDVVKECASADRRMTGTSHLEIWHKGYRGAGGSCLPKDLDALLKFAKDKGSQLELLEKVREINKTLCKK